MSKLLRQVLDEVEGAMLSPTVKHLLTYLACKAADRPRGQAWTVDCPVAKMGRDTSMGRATVHRCLVDLVARGWLVRETATPGAPVVYRITVPLRDEVISE